MTTRHRMLLTTLTKTLTLAQHPTLLQVSSAHLIKLLYKAETLHTSLNAVLRRTRRAQSRRTP